MSPSPLTLIINTGTLGDAIITALIFNDQPSLAIRDELFLVIRKEYSDIFRNQKNFHRIICLDRTRYKWSLTYRIRFLKELRSHNFRRCINLTSARGISSDEIALLSGAQTVWCFFNTWIKLKKAFSEKMDSYYDLVLFKDIYNEYERHHKLFELISGTNYVFSSFQSDSTAVEYSDHVQRFAIPNKYIVIAPCASDEHRAWESNRYKSLIDMLTKNYFVVLVGTRNERAKIEAIKNRNERVINLAGQLKLDEVHGLLQKCSLFIGNDSGLSHIAVRTNSPMIAIIGGGNFKRYFPYRPSGKRVFLYHMMDCFGCEWICHLREKYCLTKVDPSEVFEKSIMLLECK